jgi:predicted Zn-ribbon and HTH transcriptional regulator
VIERPSFEVADIVRAHRSQFTEEYGHLITADQIRVLNAIENCRTAVLGGHVSECDQCGHQVISYNSCRNRHCPKCQGASREQWLAERTTELLPVPYFHVVFTLPHFLAPLALQNKKAMYGMLFRAASETLLEVAKDPKHLGADIGFLGVLHTWGQNLLHHPHIHFVIPGGGLSDDHMRWISSGDRFLLPVKVLSRVFRGKFLSFLRRAFRKGKLVFHGDLTSLAEDGAFNKLVNRAFECEWVVYAKPPFNGPEQVLRYLARYTHRVAISNSRILSVEGDEVTFRWKDYAHGNKNKAMTVKATEFLRRFLIHVLPKGFVRIRFFGFLANRRRAKMLAVCRELLNANAQTRPASTGEATEPAKCPNCNSGYLRTVEDLQPQLPCRRTSTTLRFDSS